MALMLCYGLVLTQSLLKRADYLVFDWQSQHVSKQLKSDSNIVVIAIDDYSLAKMQAIAGMWVWPRTVHGQLISTLNNHSPRAIVFDILFAEKDRYRPDADDYFNEVLAETKHVYFAILQQNTLTGAGVLLGEYPKELPLRPSNTAQVDAKASFVLPLAIDKSHWQLGTINFTADFDGIGRNYDVIRDISGWQIPSLAATVVSNLKLLDLTDRNSKERNLNEWDSKNWLKNTAISNKNILLQWRGNAQQPYATFSYVDVYQAAIAHDTRYLSQFDNKIILIGATASGLYDARATPVNNNLPGVYMLAMAIDNLKNNGYLQTMAPLWQIFIGLTLIMLISSAFVLISSYLKQLAYIGLIVVICSLVLWQLSTFLLLQQQLLYIGALLSFILLSYLLFALFYGYVEYQQRRQTLTMFGRFLHPLMVKQLLKQDGLSPQKLNQKKVVTVLFSDIRNFTQYAEKKSAEDVLQLLNKYFDQQVKVIFSCQGTLDKFIGDCVMAFWGAPLTQENHAQLAIKAALAMEESLIEFKKTLPSSLADFDIGIGIHTGECIVGMVGANLRLDYTVIGDTVNLASRIEGLTKNKRRILVSEQCKKLAEHAYKFEYIGEYKVKGRQALVHLYSPISIICVNNNSGNKIPVSRK